MSEVTLTCGCCGISRTFASYGEAFKAGWDEPMHLPSWPVSCELCPGMMQVAGIQPWHAEQHELWKKNGRPIDFLDTLSERHRFDLLQFQDKLKPYLDRIRKKRN